MSEPVKQQSISDVRIREISQKKRRYQEIETQIEAEKTEMSKIIADLSAENMNLVTSASDSSKSRRKKLTSGRSMQDMINKREQAIEKLKKEQQKIQEELVFWQDAFDITDAQQEM